MRQEVVNFIVGEAKRLIEKGLYKLLDQGKIADLKEIKCKFPNYVKQFVKREALQLRDEEIPDGFCRAIAFWLHESGIEVANGCFFEDEIAIRARLREESAWGERVSILMKRQDCFIIPDYEFFSW